MPLWSREKASNGFGEQYVCSSPVEFCIVSYETSYIYPIKRKKNLVQTYKSIVRITKNDGKLLQKGAERVIMKIHT